MTSNNGQNNRFNTRYLGQRRSEIMPDRKTNPLDGEIPNRIDLRIGGTASTLSVPLRDMVILGRNESPEASGQADVDLTAFEGLDRGVSRQHAMIMVSDGRVAVKDLNSTNGTFLNGYALQPLRVYRLRHGDELSLGRLVLQVSFAMVPVNN